MLPKINRADRKTITHIFLEGRFVNSPYLTLKFMSVPGQYSPHISCIVPKTTSKNAVRRNLLRRRGYTALTNQKIPENISAALIFNKKSLERFGQKSSKALNTTAIIEALHYEIENILRKIH